MKFIVLHKDGKEVLVKTQHITAIKETKYGSDVQLGLHTVQVQESLKKIKTKIEKTQECKKTDKYVEFFEKQLLHIDRV